MVVAVVGSVMAGAMGASAYWSATGSGSAAGQTGRLMPPSTVVVPSTASTDVPVSWTPASAGVEATGFVITRHHDGSVAAACGTSPSQPLQGSPCTDIGVPDGTYTYVVTAVHATWTASSAPSAEVVVTAPGILGAAGSYSVLAGTTVVNTGLTTLSGDVGVSPGTAVTGFPPGVVGGTIHAGDADAAQAQDDFVVAYDDLAARPAAHEVTLDLGGQTLTPGIYHSTAALALTGVLTLDGQGDPDATFIFQTDAAFDTAAASRVILTDGAQPANVFWVVTGAAGTGADSFLSGTILAEGAITLGAGTELIGQALSAGAVTLSTNTVRFTVALPPTISIDGGPLATTTDVTPTITGTSNAAPGSVVTATVAGQTMTTTADLDGAWTVTTAPLAAGPHAVVVKVRDAAGNGSAASQTLTVEVDPPAVDLGSAGTYSVLAGTAVVNTGPTLLSGDLGVDPGTTVTGFPPGTLGGTIHTGDAEAQSAQADLLAALGDASSRTPHTEIASDLGGKTFHVGVHHSTAALALTGVVTLDGQGDPEATFIFQTDAAFTTAASSEVLLINGAHAANVFWVVTGAAGTGANTSLAGTILARGAITLGAGTELIGGALSRDAVTLDSNTISGTTPAPAFGQRSSLDAGTDDDAAGFEGATSPSRTLSAAVGAPSWQEGVVS